MTKAPYQFHRTWIEQCEATEGIRLRHGAESAFDYVVGEKLFSYAEAALTRPEFARELPTFVSEIRRMFSREEIEMLWPRIERQIAEQMESDLYQMEGAFRSRGARGPRRRKARRGPHPGAVGRKAEDGQTPVRSSHQPQSGHSVT